MHCVNAADACADTNVLFVDGDVTILWPPGQSLISRLTLLQQILLQLDGGHHLLIPILLGSIMIDLSHLDVVQTFT